MNYFLKVYGSAKSAMSAADFDKMGKLEGAAYYLHTSKIFFGENKPAYHSIGDIFIQYAPLGLKSKDKIGGRILGVYQSTSDFKKGSIGGIGAQGIPQVFVNYVDVKNLNQDFSERSRGKNQLLNIREEKNNINFPTGAIANGFAYLSEEDGRYLEDKIKNFK